MASTDADAKVVVAGASSGVGRATARVFAGVEVADRVERARRRGLVAAGVGGAVVVLHGANRG